MADRIKLRRGYLPLCPWSFRDIHVIPCATTTAVTITTDSVSMSSLCPSNCHASPVCYHDSVVEKTRTDEGVETVVVIIRHTESKRSGCRWRGKPKRKKARRPDKERHGQRKCARRWERESEIVLYYFRRERSVPTERVVRSIVLASSEPVFPSGHRSWARASQSFSAPFPHFNSLSTSLSSVSHPYPTYTRSLLFLVTPCGPCLSSSDV